MPMPSRKLMLLAARQGDEERKGARASIFDNLILIIFIKPKEKYRCFLHPSSTSRGFIMLFAHVKYKMGIHILTSTQDVSETPDEYNKELHLRLHSIFDLVFEQ